jgi:hypothetical protein
MNRIRTYLPRLGFVCASPRHVTRVLSKAFIGWAMLLLVSAAVAYAGKYHAYSCRTPSGTAAPADGWTGSVPSTGSFSNYVRNTCNEGGALVAALKEETTHFGNVDEATWTLQVPTAETLTAATIWRANREHWSSGEKALYQTWMSGPTEPKVFDACNASQCPGQGEVGNPFANINRVVVPSANLGTHLYANVNCFAPLPPAECGHGFGDPSGYAAAEYVYAADLVLEQTELPTAGSPSGSLATETPIHNISDIIFTASDPGSGIFQAVFNVDGNVVQSSTINENGGHCRNVGQTTDGLPAFLYLQPCLKSLTADVGFDTTKVSNGTHHLIVTVSDAAGNTATVLDRNVIVENRSAIVENEQGTCNAECDSHAILRAADARLLRRAFLRRYANSGLALTGQLVDHAGSPMRGAAIELRQQASYPGARSVLIATTTTDARGMWGLRVPKGPSRLLTVGYRSYSKDPSFATQLQYRETVTASVRLSAPRRARPGRAFAFRGYLAGGYVPPGGTLVSLEIYYGGEWREIALLRTNRRGTFHYRYTFAPIGPSIYRFRAQLPYTIGYPFASAASRSSYIHLAR